MRRALIVAGPTCSGKSALAMDLAERLGGVVINADSMQVYRELRIVTARPSAADEARVPHRLYGVRQACEPGNAAWWRAAALAEMAAAEGVSLAALVMVVDGARDPAQPLASALRVAALAAARAHCARPENSSKP